jgi:hypothetical protein
LGHTHIIYAERNVRFNSNSVIKTEDRTYYASTTHCRWVRQLRKLKRDKVKEEIIVVPQNEEYLSPYDSVEIIAQYSFYMHVLYCHDLLANKWNHFMDELRTEQNRLLENKNSQPKKEFKKFFVIFKHKYARQRFIDFNFEEIKNHYNNYAGHICFLTNDIAISTAADDLNDYSTKDYFEKDFDELKNELDMKRIRVHTDGRMGARLFIQFIAEIFIREIRLCLNGSYDCKKLSRRQISANIKSIYKIKFNGSSKDVYPTLSKNQRNIF